jgi:hypothetical protein
MFALAIGLGLALSLDLVLFGHPAGGDLQACPVVA